MSDILQLNIEKALADSGDRNQEFSEPKAYENLTFADDFMFCKVLAWKILSRRHIISTVLRTGAKRIQISA